ncbi:MAG: hypothetical protein AB8B56_17210 [Crocinitomicaceae bacterium]
MKKKINALIFTLIIPIIGFSQSQFGAGFGLLKSTQDNSQSHYGFEIFGKREVTEKVRGVIDLGFYTNTETFSGVVERVDIIPICVGLDYSFLQNKIQPFVGVNAGLMMALISNSFGSGSVFRPVIAPLAGVDYQFGEHFGMNINFKFDFVFYRDESTTGPDFNTLINPNIGVIYVL